MAEDTTTVETVTPAAPSNEPGNTPAPATDNKSSAELEAIRKEKAQLEMERNQLRNKLAEKEAADAEAKQKQLEENEEWKTLAEQRQAKLDELEAEKEAATRASELATATEEVFKDYPANVIKVAKTAGLSLTDNTEAGQTSLKEKLDAIKEEVGSSQPRPGANNPHTPASPEPEHAETVTKLRNGEKDALFQIPAVKSAIEKMKAIANA